ncbi:MAG: zinc-binding dehydrogenase [Crocinitomicaceae bacterium]|nr:zinc-binding dehydrogenase [Crocinitomicaceae bacterium]
MMRAAFLVREGNSDQAFEIRNTSIPEINDDEVLIKVESFGLNFADVMSRRGLYGDAPKLPGILGYEVVGTVAKTNSNSTQLLGKRVVAFTRFGGYAEFVKTPVFAVSEIGDMDAGVAASLAVQFATAYYMAVDHMNLFPGDKVLIHAAAGGVGTILVQLCKWKGCEVYATASSNDKLDYLKSIGADHVINHQTEDYEKQIRLLLSGKKLKATFNPIGGTTFKKDLRLVGAGGSVISFGGSERTGKKWGILSTLNFVRQMGLMIPIKLVMTSKSVVGVNMLKIADQDPETMKRCLLASTKLIDQNIVKPHVGGRFHIDELAKAHDFLESRNSMGKIIVNW